MRFLAGLLITGSLLGVAVLSGRSSEIAEPEPAAGEARSPVLVELFTSEGCASCPPADALLMRLNEEGRVAGAEVIVLSEHVDYWNYIGWTDPFSSAQYSERQSRYAEALGSQVYTPQMVVDGREDFVGSDERQARAAIVRASRERKAQVGIETSAGANGKTRVALRVTELPTLRAGARAILLLAITEDHLSVAVSRGENSGRRLSHTSVVRWLKRVAELDGGKDFQTEIEVSTASDWKAKDLRAVAIVQESGSGRVLGVGRVKLWD